jgi:hypothetical protein
MARAHGVVSGTVEPVVSQANLKDFSTKALMEISASKLE